jgi:hypothetical protein
MNSLNAASQKPEPKDYELPRCDLLIPGDDVCYESQAQEVRRKAKILERTFADFGFQVLVAEDACATRYLKYGDTTIPAEHVHKAFLAALGSYGKVLKSEEIIALLGAEMVK